MPAEPRPASIDRQQIVLRSIDVEQLIDEGHSARLIWVLIGRLDLSLYHAQIEAVEGRAGREHTDPRLLVRLWIYAYGRGVSSARELARQCEYEPGCQWLCGLQAIIHRYPVRLPFRSQRGAGRSVCAGVGHDERRRVDPAGTGQRWTGRRSRRMRAATVFGAKRNWRRIRRWGASRCAG